MRTTVDLDPDVLRALRDRAHRLQASMKEALNSSIRLGLQDGKAPSGVRYQCPTFSMGNPVSPKLNLDKAITLADSLEDAEVVREMESRK